MRTFAVHVVARPGMAWVVESWASFLWWLLCCAVGVLLVVGFLVWLEGSETRAATKRRLIEDAGLVLGKRAPQQIVQEQEKAGD